MSNLTPLGENLKRARKLAFPRDTLADFALRVGVSRAIFQRMERGEFSLAEESQYSSSVVKFDELELLFWGDGQPKLLDI